MHKQFSNTYMFSQCVLVYSEHIKATPYEKSLNVSFKCSYFTIVLYTMYIYITVCSRSTRLFFLSE